MVFGMFVQEFLYDVREVAGQRLSHLRTGVFARYITAYCHELVQCDVVPVVDVGFVLLYQFQFLLRIVYERT